MSLGLAGCAGKRSRTAPSTNVGEQYGPTIQEATVDSQKIEQTYGPPTEAPTTSNQAQAPAEALGPPVPPEGSETQETPKLCLLLSPGMAKAIAHAAILEAIKKANIPVHCVVGSEMGALVGALYSQAKSGSTNGLQWQLFKLTKANYFNFPLLSLGGDPKSSGKKLHEFIAQIFRDKKIESLPIRFGVTATEAESGSVRLFEQGNLAAALSASMAMPAIFEPWLIDGKKFISGAVSSPVSIELARKLGGNFFVIVDVAEDISDGAKGVDRFQRAFVPVKNLIRLQKKEATFVIQVKTGAIHYDDFGRQGEILQAGATAAEQAIPELKQLWEKAIATK